MTKQRISGGSFDIDMDGVAIHAEKFSLDITDDSKAVTQGGRPSGWVKGQVSASGTLTLSIEELSKIRAKAASAGSWQEIKPMDFVAYANTGDEEQKVEVFGAKVKLNKILEADKSNSDATTIELPFEVTSPDFIKIDGIPYIKPKQ